MRAGYIDIESVEFLPGNPKDHDIGEIHGAMGEFGFIQRMLVNEDTGHLLAGHGRVVTLRQKKAMGEKPPKNVLEENGRWLAPCDFESVPLADEMRIAIALNRLEEKGGWVETDLAGALEGLMAQGEEMLRGTGFDADDLDALVARLQGDKPQEPREKHEWEKQYGTAEKLQEKWGVAYGDIYRIGAHTLICGDCREPDDWVKLLAAANVKKVTGLFTSPPYAEQRKGQYGGVKADDYVDWWGALQTNARRFIQDDGSFFINIKSHVEDGERSLYVHDLVGAMVRRWGWSFVDEYCWLRPGLPRQVKYTFKNAFESVYHFAAVARCFKFYPEQVMIDSDAVPDKSGPSGGGSLADLQGHDSWLFGGQDYQVGKAYPSNVIRPFNNNAKNMGHEASFPPELPTFFIQAFSQPGDAWLDPFSGSGTTILAAHKNGRIGLGVEILPKFCSVTLERLTTELELVAERICGL